MENANTTAKRKAHIQFQQCTTIPEGYMQNRIHILPNKKTKSPAEINCQETTRSLWIYVYLKSWVTNCPFVLNGSFQGHLHRKQPHKLKIVSLETGAGLSTIQCNSFFFWNKHQAGLLTVHDKRFKLLKFRVFQQWNKIY